MQTETEKITMTRQKTEREEEEVEEEVAQEEEKRYILVLKFFVSDTKPNAICIHTPSIAYNYGFEQRWRHSEWKTIQHWCVSTGVYPMRCDSTRTHNFHTFIKRLRWLSATLKIFPPVHSMWSRALLV